MRAYKTAAAAALGLALAACGGGGGGGDDAPAGLQASGDFTAGTYQAETDQALEPLLLAFAFDGTIGTAQPFAGDDPRAQAAAAGMVGGGASTLQGGRLERRLFEALLARGGRVQAQATEDLGSAPCTGGGSLHLTVTYSDPEGDFTPGDRIDARSVGCIEDGQAIGGTLSLVLSEFNGGATSSSFKAHLIADDFGGTALRIDGTGQLTLVTNADDTAGTLTIAYTGMSVIAGAEQFIWDHGYTYVYGVSSETFALDGYVAVNGHHYGIRQDQPFIVDGSGVLTSGRMSLLDKDGDRVQIDASAGDSSYTFFAAGNGTPVGPVAGLPLGN